MLRTTKEILLIVFTRFAGFEKGFLLKVPHINGKE